MSAACDNLEDTTDNTMLKESSSNGSSNDSGLSDDDDEEDEVSDLETGEDSEEEEEDEEINDEPSSSPIFDPVLRGTTAKPLLPSPPKAIYNDRFWNNTYNQQQHQLIWEKGCVKITEHLQNPSLTFNDYFPL